MDDNRLGKARHEAAASTMARFAVLERARQSNDFELAAKAKRELDHLGMKATPSGAKRRKAVEHGPE